LQKLVFAVENARRRRWHFAKQGKVAALNFLGAYAADPFAPMSWNVEPLICPSPKPRLDLAEGDGLLDFHRETDQPVFFTICEPGRHDLSLPIVAALTA
jgi:hypothetical protein